MKIGDPVKLIKVHREEDRRFVEQLARITDGSGFITDFVITFGNGEFIGVLEDEIEPAPPKEL